MNSLCYFFLICSGYGIGYYARLHSLRLTPFPTARRRGLNKITSHQDLTQQTEEILREVHKDGYTDPNIIFLFCKDNKYKYMY